MHAKATLLLAVSMLAISAAAEDGADALLDAAWHPAGAGDALNVQCAAAREWTTRAQKWMAGRTAWCAVEVGYDYAGANGDLRLVVRPERHPAAREHGYASVTLPAKDAEFPFQFIFPCPQERAQPLCVSYESTADAAQLLYGQPAFGRDVRTIARNAPSEALPPASDGPAPVRPLCRYAPELCEHPSPPVAPPLIAAR